MEDLKEKQAVLRKSITTEACIAAGLPLGGWKARIFSALFWLPAQRFSKLGVEFDNRVSEDGFTAAMRWLLPKFAKDVTVHGAENIPLDGPVMVVSNHPGAFDGLVITAQFKRDDIKIIVSDVPFTRGFQAATRHLIYSTGEDTHERMSAVRQSLRHLRNGGVLMLFPTGLVDPDPAVMQGAEEALQDWSPSLEFLLRQVPQARLLPVIVSGVIDPKYLNNFIARRQNTIRGRQKLAEYFEIGKLMVLQKDLGLTPRVSFGRPVTIAEIVEEPGSTIMEKIIAQASRLLIHHTQARPE